MYLHTSADLTAADIASASVGRDAADPAIEISFTEDGARKAAKLSEEHAGKPVAVVEDGRVLAAPVIRAKLGGSVRITSHFTADEAAKLVKAINGK